MIFRGLSDTRTSLLGQANTLNEMGIVANATGRQRTNKTWHHEYAEEVLKNAWKLYCDLHVDDSIGMANSAKNLGVTLTRLGESREATMWLYRSLAKYTERDQ